MKIEVGKWYRDPDGTVVKITDTRDACFTGNNGKLYNQHGVAITVSPGTLVAEVPELSLGDWCINEGRVPDADVTAVRYRDGDVVAKSVDAKDFMDWTHGGGSSDIVAYCTSPFESVTCSSNKVFSDISELDRAAGDVKMSHIFTVGPGSTIEFTFAPEPEIDMTEPGYEMLADVLQRAYDQAAKGKGKERHAQAGEPFDEQVMQQGAQRFGVGALLFQAFKKSEESQRLPHDAAIKELLGGIVYLAGAVIALEKGKAS